MGTVDIEARGLTKRFGDVVALDGLDLAVASGTIVGLLGPNGAGKTTVVRILTTTLVPDGGSARVLGHDVVTDPAAVRPSIGLAGQFAAVDEILTGRENLRLVGRLAQVPRAVARRRADELLAEFDLEGAADRPVRTYSGGMRRRLDVAAALVHRPRVLFLDEPTTGLDPVSRFNLWRLLERLVAEGVTILLTTQYMEEADRLASRVTVIDCGRAIAEGSPAALKSRLGSSSLLVGLADPDSARAAATALAGAGSAAPTVGHDTVVLPVLDGAVALPTVMRLLDQRGLTPRSIAVREPTLDDVFVALTGHPADPTTGTEDGTPRLAGTGEVRR